MDEELNEYIRNVKNDNAARDAQACRFIDEILTIHDDAFENGINNFNTDIKTLMLSFFERLSYLDRHRASYDTYLRFASFLDTKARRASEYQANAEKDAASAEKGAYSLINIFASVSGLISDPSFRVYLILLAVAVFKDEGTLTKKQKDYLEALFKALRIKID